MTSVLVLNGPNLNLLGIRQPDVYGSVALGDIERACKERAQELGLEVSFAQSNHEGRLIDWIHDARTAHDGIVFNPGAYSHTSVALMDAINAVKLPVVEVHLSNIYRREKFRTQSYISLAAHGVISGLGLHGYLLALDAIDRLITEES